MNRREYERKLRKWEAEGYDVSELREKWFPTKKSHVGRWLSIVMTIFVVVAVVAIWQTWPTPTPAPPPAPKPIPASPPAPAPASAPKPTLTALSGSRLLYVVTSEGVLSVNSTGDAQVIIDEPSNRGLEVIDDNLYLLPGRRTHSNEILNYDAQGNFRYAIPIPSNVPAFQDFVALPNREFALLDNEMDKIYFVNQLGDLLAKANILNSRDSHLQNVDGVVVDDWLIFSEDGNNNVLRFHINKREKSLFKNLSNLSHWLGAITYENGYYYICGPKQIYAFSNDSDTVKLAEIPENNITGIVVVDNNAYVSVNFAGKIYKVDLTNGSSEVFVSGLDYPEDIEAVQ